MSNNPAKDFGPIAEDYSFFESHATEAIADVRAYGERLRGVGDSAGTIRMLDFGCGSGTFTLRLLEHMQWRPERLRLTLVEPVETARRAAVERVRQFSAVPVTAIATLPDEIVDRYDVILANHVLYYVPELQSQLAKLIGSLSATGVFTAAIAGRTNTLIEFWKVGFGLLGRDIPYHVSEDVESSLRALGVDYDKRQVGYELSFPDTEENRMRIIRFLLADYLPQMPQDPLLHLFDPYSQSGRIEIRTASDHFTIRSGPTLPLPPAVG